MARNWSQESYLKAYQFAAITHNRQLISGTNLPYIMHLSLVSMEGATLSGRQATKAILEKGEGLKKGNEGMR